MDRSKTVRNAALTRAIRDTRTKLQHGNEDYFRFPLETAVLYINTFLQSAAALPLLVVGLAVVSLTVTSDTLALRWTILILLVHALQVMILRHLQKKNLITEDNVERWTLRFLILQLMSGACWGYFAIQACNACNPTSYVIFKGAALLVVLSATAISTFLLRGAILFTFAPTIAALLLQYVLYRDRSDLGLLAMFSASMVFFNYVTDRLRRSTLQGLSFQSEKDDLIAELEMAKSISDEARRRAEEANLAKSRFLASMSHELRTPLNAILGFSEVMSSEILGPLNNPSYKEYAADIHRSGEHLLHLINEILDLSRIEAGRYELQEEAVSLQEIADDCVGMVQLRAGSKSIRINEQFEPNLPAVWADVKAIRQVVLNLLSNAVKFTPQGGEIMVKAGWTVGGGQYVSIKDNGPGIPEDEIPVVLSAFGQGSVAIKSAEQGTGLGLPIVQAILAKHEGEFILRSKLREGTEVIAILPANRVLESQRVEAVHANEKRKRSFA